MRTIPLRPSSPAAAPSACLLCVTFLSFAAGGCVQKRAHSLAAFEPQSPRESVTRMAPDSAVYKVKWADRRHGQMRTVRGSKRLVAEGAPLGFARTADGRVLAVAGPETFPLKGLPPSAKYCVWYYKTEEPSPAASALEVTAQAVGTAALVTGVVAGAVVLEGLDDDDDDDESDYEKAERRRQQRRYREEQLLRSEEARELRDAVERETRDWQRLMRTEP